MTVDPANPHTRPAQPALVPTRYITEIGKSLSGAPIAVAYDFCRCGQHVVNCKCVGGPFEPGYITAMRDRETAITAAREAEKAEKASNGAATSVGTNSVTSKASDQAQSPVSLATAVRDKCDVCGKAATSEDADQNDDGTWTHHDCQ